MRTPRPSPHLGRVKARAGRSGGRTEAGALTQASREVEEVSARRGRGSLREVEVTAEVREVGAVQRGRQGRR